MNTFHTIDVSYLRPSRTIETVLLKNETKERVLYIYNFEGWHFRVYNNLIDLINFFDDNFEPEVSIESDHELDRYLESIDLDNENFTAREFS